jgi:hypothetical protein
MFQGHQVWDEREQIPREPLYEEINTGMNNLSISPGASYNTSSQYTHQQNYGLQGDNIVVTL